MSHFFLGNCLIYSLWFSFKKSYVIFRNSSCVGYEIISVPERKVKVLTGIELDIKLSEIDSPTNFLPISKPNWLF